MLRARLAELGVLRAMLLAIIAILIVSAPFAEGEADYSLARIWPTLLAAPVALMMAFVLPLDLLMTCVFMSGKDEAERARYRRILAAEGAAFVLLILVWTPFFASLLER